MCAARWRSDVGAVGMAVAVFVPSRIGGGDFIDLPAPTAGDDAKAITYNHSTQAFVYAAAGGGTPPGSDTQVIINDGGAYGADAGLTYAKATDRLTVTGGLVAPSMRPASDSTTALQWQTAAGTAFLTGDSTNQKTIAYTTVASGAVRVPLAVDSDGITRLSINSPTASGNTGVGFFVNNALKWSAAAYAAGGTNYSFVFFNDQSGGSSFFINGDNNNVGFGLGNTSPTAGVDIPASTTARASSRQRAGTAPTAPEDGDMWNDGNAYAMRVNGTNAVNTDGGLSIWMQSSTTARNVGRVLWQYTDKTDATRVTKGALTAYYQSTEHKAIHWSADVNGPTLSFGPVTTPIATPVLATGASATPDDIIAVLQSYGLVKQS